jgi:RNA polymerase sigma factor (sigma-70 family)
MAGARLDTVLDYVRAAAAARGATEQTDDELLRAFASANDQAAFTALVRRHGPLVLAVCRRLLHHEQDAEDAFQAAFLVLARKAKSMLRPRSLAGWLHGLAYRIAMNARRAAGRRRKHEGQASAAQPASPDWEAAWREVQLLLDREVQRLPQKYREPFVLCCLEGHSGVEAARRLGLKEGTVWSRLGHARRRLRARLAARGVSLAAVLGAATLAAEPARGAVAATLVRATVRWAVGRSAAGAVPPRVATLAEGVLKAMLLNQLKTVTAVLLALAVAGGLLYRTWAAAPPVAAAGSGQIETPPAPPGARPAAAPAMGSQAKTAPKPGPIDMPLAVAFAPGGRLTAVGGGGRQVLICDARTGALVRALPSPGDAIRRALAFSPDGRLLAAGGDDGAVHLWDMRTGKRLRTLAGHAGWVTAVAFSPDGRMLASGSIRWPDGRRDEGQIKLWDARTGELKQTWQVDDGDPRSLAFAPDGRTLASGEGVLRLRDVRTGAVKQTFTAERGKILLVAFAADGRSLAGGGGHWVRVGNGTLMISAVRLWDLPSGKLRATLTDIGPWLRSLAFSPDGKVLATGSSGPIRQDGSLTWVSSELRLWDAGAGRLLRAAAGGLGDLRSVAFSPDGRTVLTCDEAEVALTETLTGLRRATLLTTPHGVPRRPGATAGPMPDGEAAKMPAPRGVARLWEGLAGADAAAAYRALAALEAAPREAVPFLAKHLRPAEGAEPERVARLVADLQSATFKTRERAFRELEKLGDVAEQPLMKVLAAPPSVEAARRAEVLLGKLDARNNPERLRALRAVEALEHIGTPEARQVLQALAGGAAEARLTREARESLGRLARRAAVSDP